MNLPKYEEISKICSSLRMNEIEIETWGLTVFIFLHENS
jgi:hypothetical protein